MMDKATLSKGLLHLSNSQQWSPTCAIPGLSQPRVNGELRQGDELSSSPRNHTNPDKYVQTNIVAFIWVNYVTPCTFTEFVKFKL